MEFEKLYVEVWFADTKIATQGILLFSLRNDKTRLGQIRLVLDSIVLPVKHMVEHKKQVTSNRLNYEVISKFKVKVVLEFIQYSYWLKGSCQLQLTSPSAGGLLSRNYALQKKW